MIDNKNGKLTFSIISLYMNVTCCTKCASLLVNGFSFEFLQSFCSLECDYLHNTMDISVLTLRSFY